MGRNRIGACIVVMIATFAVGVPVGAQEAQPSTLTGRVLLDGDFRPIEGVDVSISGLSSSATTDAKGAFKLEGIPAGIHTVIARRIGFAIYESQIAFGPGATVDRRILLPMLQTLDSVRVVGDTYLPVSFIDHRAKGFGHFMTRADLARNNSRMLSDVIAQIPGLGLIQGTRNEGWVLSKRHAMSIRSIAQVENHPGDDIYIPAGFEAAHGLTKGCYARVYLDNQLLNPYTPAEPVNVNEFSPDRLEAIEYYSGPSQTPPEYSRLNSTCGVLVLHTRRSP